MFRIIQILHSKLTIPVQVRFDIWEIWVANKYNAPVCFYCIFAHKSSNYMLPILYQDDYYVAINKPAGLLVHRTHIAADAEEFALQNLRDQIGKHIYTIHRLDRPTSGVLLFALSSEAAHKAIELFTEKKIKKEYAALVRGWSEDAGSIDKPLKKFEESTIQTALTHYQTLHRCELSIPVHPYDTARYSWVSVQTETGRRHQIRRHLAYLNHPVIGDAKHGDRNHNHMFEDKFDIKRLWLFARRLSFIHPYTSVAIQIDAPLPDKVSALMKEPYFFDSFNE